MEIESPERERKLSASYNYNDRSFLSSQTFTAQTHLIVEAAGLVENHAGIVSACARYGGVL